MAAASGLPLVDDALPGRRRHRRWADPLREGHRILPLFLVWLAPAAAHGLGPPGSSRFEGAPLVGLGAALVLVGPSLWGFGGQVDPVDGARRVG